MATLQPRIAALDEARFLSLATVSDDGRPHVVTLWFIWDGETIAVVSKGQARKVRNLVRDPRAMVGIGEPGADGRLIEVIAEVMPDASRVVATAFARKYRDRLCRLGVAIEGFLETYPVLIRLSPTRWLAWGEAGWASDEVSLPE